MAGKESLIQRAVGVALFSLMIVAALVWTGMYGQARNGGQNENANKRKIQDVTERRGDAIHPKKGYELFKQDNKIYARRRGENVKGEVPKGAIICTCDGSGSCIPNISLTDGSGHCAKDGNNPCQHCEISFSQ